MTSSRRRFIAGAGAVAGAAIAGAPAIVTGQQPAKWKMQTLWSAAEITHKAFEDLCARIGKATNGRLEIQPFAAGAVVGVPRAVRRHDMLVISLHCVTGYGPDCPHPPLQRRTLRCPRF